MSIRATSRLVGVGTNTVMRLLVEAAAACNAFQDGALHDLPCRTLQVDELWAFVYAKEKTVMGAKAPPQDAGDVWTWTALCDDTKLLASWRVGDRSAMTGLDLMDDLRKRIPHRIQMTTDGHGAYFQAVEGAFGGDIDYAQLIKVYGNDPLGDRTAKARYSPGECTSTHVVHVSGRPDLSKISTSYVERHNLTMRMSMRRFTRLTNAFSKKLENHTAAVSLYAMNYNWCRPHQSLKGRTPAQAAGLTKRKMTAGDIVKLMDEAYEAARPKTRGPYKKRSKT